MAICFVECYASRRIGSAVEICRNVTALLAASRALPRQIRQHCRQLSFSVCAASGTGVSNQGTKEPFELCTDSGIVGCLRCMHRSLTVQTLCPLLLTTTNHNNNMHMQSPDKSPQVWQPQQGQLCSGLLLQQRRPQLQTIYLLEEGCSRRLCPWK